jgi:Gpi18-like mannosyltransferase
VSLCVFVRLQCNTAHDAEDKQYSSLRKAQISCSHACVQCTADKLIYHTSTVTSYITHHISHLYHTYHIIYACFLETKQSHDDVNFDSTRYCRRCIYMVRYGYSTATAIAIAATKEAVATATVTTNKPRYVSKGTAHSELMGVEASLPCTEICNALAR